MILRNDFPERDSIVKQVDKRLYFANLIIVKEPKGTIPFNKGGNIHLPEGTSELRFTADLIHEIGHSVFDPITVKNYIDCCYAVETSLKLDSTIALKLCQTITDMILPFHIRRDRWLKSRMKEDIENLFKERKGKLSKFDLELFSIYKGQYGCKLPIRSRFHSKVKKIVETETDRRMVYVKIAKLLCKRHKGRLANDLASMDIKLPSQPNSEQMKETISQFAQESKDANEFMEKVKLLQKGLGKGSADIKHKLLTHDETLKLFFETKAKQVRWAIKLPTKPTRRGIKVGTQSWKLQDGIRAMDIKKTIMKYGVNIPLVTTRKPMILPKFISSHEGKKPIDLVISIDVSGSTGKPCGFMVTVADYEVIMFYALLDLAARENQRIGLTLWSGTIEYTTLPKTYDYSKFEELKKVVLVKWLGGGTYIMEALEQAKEYRNKLFFMFTDGDVYESHLINVDNVIFFLVKPYGDHYKMFIEKYGKSRVIEIRDLHKLPEIAIRKYQDLFMKA